MYEEKNKETDEEIRSEFAAELEEIEEGIPMDIGYSCYCEEEKGFCPAHDFHLGE